MKGFELLKQGAEARIYKGKYLGRPALAKERFTKTYRHPELDQHLTKERIKAESRSIVRCKNAGIPTPTIYLVDVKRQIIYMEYFEYSMTAKDFMEIAKWEDVERLSHDIGAALAKMHSSNVIHGDLTTSNILLVNKNNKNEFFEDYDDLQLVLIDFGLSYMDTSVEDKGVDLYVLERALISIHSEPTKVFKLILEAYKEQNKKAGVDVLHKLEEVRARGRKRTMVG